LIVLGLIAAFPAHAHAVESAIRTAATARSALPSPQSFAPTPEDALQRARVRLQSSVEQLDKFLATGGNQKANLWRSWLDLPGLEVELAEPRPDPVILTSHAQRYSQNQVGLELPPFAATRRELRNFLAVSEYAADDEPRELVRRRLQDLSEYLARLDVEPTAEDAQNAARLLAWLEALGEEGVNLAAAVRANYCRTNAVGQVSARLINFLLERSVAEQRFMTDVILGSYTRGTAFSQAHVSFGFFPSQEHATLELRMQGSTTCPANVAERGRIAIYSSSNTAIRANKRVFLNAEGLQLAPAVASSVTNVQINDVDAGRRLVERLAWRRVGRMTPQIEEAASQRVQAEASSKLDQQAAAALAGANNMFRQQIRAPLLRCDAWPAQCQFWTDHDHLRISLVQHNDAQLAVASRAPDFPATYDLAIGAHESMIVNLSEAVLGGATIEDQTWLELVKLLTGDPPRPLWVHDRSERWSVTLADERPIVPHFDDDQVGFTLRVCNVTRGSDMFKHVVEIEASFLPRCTRDGPELIRDGAVAVRFAKPQGTEEQEETREFLIRKFSAVFPSKLHFAGITPPDGGSLGKLNSLELAEFQSARGWLTLGYQLKTAASAE